jgi:hypothetical protein
VLTDRLGDGQYVLQVRGAVLIRRRAHGDELEQAMIHALLHVGGELEAAGLYVALDVVVQTGLVNRDLALVQPRNLVFVDVDANDVVARFGQAGA